MSFEVSQQNELQNFTTKIEKYSHIKLLILSGSGYESFFRCVKREEFLFCVEFYRY